jgi:hypothetical protein
VVMVFSDDRLTFKSFFIVANDALLIQTSSKLFDRSSGAHHHILFFWFLFPPLVDGNGCPRERKKKRADDDVKLFVVSLFLSRLLSLASFPLNVYWSV